MMMCKRWADKKKKKKRSEMRKIIHTHKKKKRTEQKRTKEAALVWTETLFLPLAFLERDRRTVWETDAEKVKEDVIVCIVVID